MLLAANGTPIQRVTETGAESRTPALGWLFRYEPPVPPETIARWQAELDRVFQPADQISRLVLRWEAGDEWQPVQRWIIWQCQDPKTSPIPPFMLDALNGPNPRSTGHYCAPGLNSVGKPYCACLIKGNKWVKTANRFVDRQTWELYRDTGLYGRRWWVIQGKKGGHRFLWDSEELESKLSALMGGPSQTPDAGDLAYAPFDQRVMDKIGQLDQVKTWTRTLDFAARNADHLEAEQRDAAFHAREALWKWIDWGIEEAWDEGGRYFKQYLSDEYGRAKPGETGRSFDYEEVERQFYERD